MNRNTLIGLFISTALLAACGGTSMTQGETASGGIPANLQHAGFLSDYAKLEPVKGSEGTYRYINTAAKPRSCNTVVIDPVQIFLAPNAEYSGLQPDALQRMAEMARNSFAEALLSGYRLVQQPEPGAIRLRLAITGIQATRPGLNASDFLPIKAVFNVARNAAGVAPQVAEMSAELEVLDADSQVIGAAMLTRKGDKTLAQGERVTWTELQPIAAFWAKALRQQLDRACGRTPM